MRSIAIELVSVVTAVLFSGTAVAQNEPQRAGGIVAEVGDTVITQADLDRVVNMRRDAAEPSVKSLFTAQQLRAQHQALERIIEDKIVLHLVKSQEQKDGKPYIAPEQIEQELKNRVKRLKDDGFPVRTVEDLYRVFQDDYGQSRKEARQFIKERMSVDKYMWGVVYRQRVNSWVTPQQARYYYKANPKQFSMPLEVTFRQIFIKRGRPDAELAIEAVEKGLVDGAPFSELAQTYDEAAFEGEPERAGRRKTRSFEELKGWLFPIPQKLAITKTGEVTGRIDTAAGTHFFKVDDVVEGTPKSFGEALEEIQDQIRGDRRLNVRKRFLAKHRQRTRIAVFLPPLPGSKKSGNNGKN